MKRNTSSHLIAALFGAAILSVPVAVSAQQPADEPPVVDQPVRPQRQMRRQRDVQQDQQTQPERAMRRQRREEHDAAPERESDRPGPARGQGFGGPQGMQPPQPRLDGQPDPRGWRQGPPPQMDSPQRGLQGEMQPPWGGQRGRQELRQQRRQLRGERMHDRRSARFNRRNDGEAAAGRYEQRGSIPPGTRRWGVDRSQGKRQRVPIDQRAAEPQGVQQRGPMHGGPMLPDVRSAPMDLGPRGPQGFMPRGPMQRDMRGGSMRPGADGPPGMHQRGPMPPDAQPGFGRRMQQNRRREGGPQPDLQARLRRDLPPAGPRDGRNVDW